MKNETPWLDANGKTLSANALKEACKTWKPATWECYLKSIESTLSEQVLKNPIAIEYFHEDVFEYVGSLGKQSKKYRFLRSHFLTGISALSPRQQKIIKLKYIENLSDVEISQTLQIGIETVRTHRKRALKKIKEIFENLLINTHL